MCIRGKLEAGPAAEDQQTDQRADMTLISIISIWHCREELEGRCVIKQFVVIVGRYKQLKQHVVIS